MADQTAKGELRLRAEHLGRAVKAGLSPIWVGVTAVVALVGGSALLGFLWGVRHLFWGLVIFLVIAVFVIIEGSYRMARQRDAEHAGQVEKLEQECDTARAEMEETRRVSVAATPEPPPFELRHYPRKTTFAGTPMTLHFVGVTNPAEQPERRVRVSAERMDPYPRRKSSRGTDPEFSHEALPESGGTPAAGMLIGPGQEKVWLIGRTWTGPDGKIRVIDFFDDTGADWELGPDERWRISYRIRCDDGMPEMQFSVVIKAEDGEGVVSLQG